MMSIAKYVQINYLCLIIHWRPTNSKLQQYNQGEERTLYNFYTIVNQHLLAETQYKCLTYANVLHATIIYGTDTEFSTKANAGPRSAPWCGLKC